MGINERDFIFDKPNGFCVDSFSIVLRFLLRKRNQTRSASSVGAQLHGVENIADPPQVEFSGLKFHC